MDALLDTYGGYQDEISEATGTLCIWDLVWDRNRGWVGWHDDGSRRHELPCPNCVRLDRFLSVLCTTTDCCYYFFHNTRAHFWGDFVQSKRPNSDSPFQDKNVCMSRMSRKFDLLVSFLFCNRRCCH